jgi:hypothetical protein
MTTEIERREAEFDYPEELPERFAWFVERVGIGKANLLYLLGAPSGEEGSVDWREVVTKGPDAALWLEGLLYDALAAFNYEPAAMREGLSRASSGVELPLPPGWHWNAQAPASSWLPFALARLGQGGPGALPIFLAILAQPAEVFRAFRRK